MCSDQSRSSLCTEYACCVGAPCSQICFNFCFVLTQLARSYENMNDHILMRCTVNLSTYKSVKSCNLNVLQSLAQDKKKKALLLECFPDSRRSEKHGQMWIWFTNKLQLWVGSFFSKSKSEQRTLNSSLKKDELWITGLNLIFFLNVCLSSHWYINTKKPMSKKPFKSTLSISFPLGQTSTYTQMPYLLTACTSANRLLVLK